ncbi:MAG: type II secretion system F family protein [Pseudomonadota bacterium]
MYTDFIELIAKPDTIVTIAVAIAAFATVLTIMIPVINGDRTWHRMRAMAIERDKMRAARLSEIRASASGERSGLRTNARGFMRTFVDRFNLKSKFESDELKAKLKMAGLRGQAPLYAYVFFRMIMPLIVMLVALLYLFVLLKLETYSAGMKVLMALGAAALGYYLPNLFVENLIQRRKQAIQYAFPDALDMLLICVQSGMSIEAAFGRVAREIGARSIELAEELSLTTAELAYLPERRLAYQNLGDRTGVEAVQSTTTAIIQAENYGTPIAQALRVMAKENRDLRMSAAEKKAAALPPKLTVPMILFFVPALIIVIIGPAVLTVLEITK